MTIQTKTLHFLFTFTLLLFTGLFMNAQNFKFGKVSKKELLEMQHPTYPEAEAAILYREIETSVDYSKEKGFYVLTDVFERVKIYNASGFEWGTVSVSLFASESGDKETISGLKAFTYTIVSDNIEEIKLSSSAIFDETQSKFRTSKKFTMPALEDGCIIEYRYKVKSPFLSNIDAFSFQESVPINKLKMRFEAPEYFSYNSHRRGWIPFNIETGRNEKTITSLKSQSGNGAWGGGVQSTGKSQLKFYQNSSEVNLQNVPPLLEEAYAGNMRNYASSLKFELSFVKFPNSIVETYSTDWESVSNTIYASESFGGQLDKRGYFEDELDEVLSGISDSNEKIVRVFEYVKAKMNWNGYLGIYTDEDVKNAFKEGSGNTADINLMLTAMFRHAGLNSSPVLVSSKSHGVPIFPTLNGFNYVISAVEIDGAALLFDATDKLGRPNILDKDLLNWQGRLIRDDRSSKWVTLHPSKPAVEAFMVNARLSANGQLQGMIKNQFTGNISLEKRKMYSGIREEDVIDLLESKYDELHISETKFLNLANPYKPLKLDFMFNSDNLAEEINGNLYVSPLLFLALEENPFKLEERKFPVDFGFPTKQRFIITIEIPEGYKVESLPEGVNVKLGDNIIAFKYLLSENKNKIQLSSEFAINRYYVTPQEYSDLKKFYQFIIDKEKEKIVLSKI